MLGNMRTWLGITCRINKNTLLNIGNTDDYQKIQRGYQDNTDNPLKLHGRHDWV